MQVLKINLFIVITIFICNNANSQEPGKWSSWKPDSVFEDLEFRYKKINKEEDRYFYQIECRNNFPHKLSFYLIMDPLLEEPDYFKFNLAENQTVQIQSKKSIYPKDLKIYSYYAALTPKWQLATLLYTK